ncbi:MAG: glycoside hydrolase family 31 protein [Clostridia bacterium]|nr:glycoside hydrolase family 31 protein [Clostridia bacterium]
MEKILKIHPDALYDSEYIDYVLETDDYASPELALKGEYKHERGVTVITTLGYAIVIENCFDNTLRLRITKPGGMVDKTVTERLGLIRTDWEPAPYDYKSEDGVITFSNARLTLVFDMNTCEYEFRTKEGRTLLKTKNGGVRFSSLPADYSGMRSYTEFERIGDERYSGFGARIYKVDRTGESADIFAEKGGAKVGDYGGFPIPYFISSAGYGFFFNDPWPHVYFDMAKTKEDEWFLSAPGGDYDVFVFCGSTSEITKSYAKIVGTNQFPKKWLMGYWCSSLSFERAQGAIDDMGRMRREGYPCEAIVIDGPWRGGVNFIRDYASGWGYPSDDYNWHPDFGDGVGMIRDLMKENIKTVLHINSCAFKPATAIPAIAQGLLRQVKTETVPDVATERGIEYYKTFLVPRIKDGVTQWWTDHSDRVSGEVLPGIPSRNLFGAMWNRVISDVMAENGIKGHMSLSRGGGIGSQPYALPWAGDTQFGIKRFKEDIWYVINAGMAGFTLCGYDLGGFMRGSVTDLTPDEMQFEINNIARRVCQSMIFCPMPRMHNGENSTAKWPWNCPEETRALYKDCLQYRYRFIPTVYSYAIHGSRTGEPIIRPLFYDHMDDRRLYAIDDEFYLGEDILVAPVTEADVTARKVYLPKGKWVDIWTKKAYKGDQTITVDAPMFKKEGLPMFVKDGGGVAYQPDCLSLYDTVSETLRVELYTDIMTEFTLHESETVTNTFACRYSGGVFEIYAENNSDIDRHYIIVVYKDGEEYKEEFDIKAHSRGGKEARPKPLFYV